MNTRETSNQLHNILIGCFFIAAALAVISLINFHYWAFGANSATGWYDERDFPLVVARLFESVGPGFSPAIAGGTSLAGAYYPTSHDSLLTMIVQALGWHYGWATYRILGPFLFCIGFAYLIFKRQRAVSSAVIGTLGGIVALYGTPYTYGWILGGYFYATMIAFAAAYVVIHFRDLGSTQSIGCLLVLSILQKTDPGAIVVFIPAFLSCWGVFLVAQKPLKDFPLYSALALLVLVFNSIVSWQDINFFQQFASDSARAARTDANISIDEIFDADFRLQEILGPLWFGTESPFVTDTPRSFGNARWIFSSIFFFSIAASTVLKRPKPILALLFYTFSYPLLVFTLGSLPVASAYRLDQCLIFGFPAVVYNASVLAADLLAKDRLSSRKATLATVLSVGLFFTWLTMITALSIASMQVRTNAVMASGLVWSRLYDAQQLSSAFASRFPDLVDKRGFIYEHAPLRLRPRHEHLLETGALMLDGNRADFSAIRTIFWSNILPENPVAPHTARQTHFTLRAETIDAHMLRLAGVGFLITSDGEVLKAQGMTPQYLGTLPSVKYDLNKGITAYVASALHLNRIEDTPAQRLYVWRLSGSTPLVFYARNVGYLEHFLGQKNRKLIKLLRGCDVLIQTTGIDKYYSRRAINSCDALRFEYHQSGLRVNSVHPDSMVILNHDFKDSTRAVCDSRPLEAYPANLFMTAIPVKSGCTVLEVTF